MKHTRKKTSKEVEQVKAILIDLPKRESIAVTIIGDTPYVGTNFSDNTQKNLLKQQSGKTKTKARAPRNIEEEVNGRRHIINEIDCIPTAAIRGAIIDVAKEKAFTEINGQKILRSIIIKGDTGNFITIKNGNGKSKHSGPTTFSSVVKLANGAKHIAYRPEYKNWSATFTIIHLENILSRGTVINLIAMAGITTGIGDTRKIGGGRFHLPEEGEI